MLVPGVAVDLVVDVCASSSALRNLAIVSSDVNESRSPWQITMLGLMARACPADGAARLAWNVTMKPRLAPEQASTRAVDPPKQQPMAASRL